MSAYCQGKIVIRVTYEFVCDFCEGPIRPPQHVYPVEGIALQQPAEVERILGKHACESCTAKAKRALWEVFKK